MLVGNGVRLGNSNPMRCMGSAQNLTVNKANWFTPGAMRNFYAGEGTVVGGSSIANTSSFPDARVAPEAWLLPPKQGNAAMFAYLEGEGSFTPPNLAGGVSAEAALAGVGSLTAGIVGIAEIVASIAGVGSMTSVLDALAVMEADLAGVGSITANLNAVLNAVATLSGSGTISDADLRSVLALAATLSGSGSISGNLSGAFNLSSTLSGSGNVTSNLTAIVNAVASLGGAGTLSATLLALGNAVATLTGVGSLAATMRADGFMEAEINVANSDPLSPDNLAAAVWNALVAEYNAAGTMGGLVGSSVGVDYDRIMREVRDALVPHIWGK